MRIAKQIFTASARALLILASALAATGCGGGASPPNPTPATPNAAPAVSASAPQPLISGQSFTLVGAATDPEGDPLTFLWELVSAPAGATPLILSPASAMTDVAGLLLAGDYAFRFTADDGDVATQVLVGVTLEQRELLATAFVDLPPSACATWSR